MSATGRRSTTPPARGGQGPRRRFEVTLNEALAEDFEALAQREDVSRADIFKRAIAAYKLLKEEEAKGARIIIREEGQPERQLVAL